MRDRTKNLSDPERCARCHDLLKFHKPVSLGDVAAVFMLCKGTGEIYSEMTPIELSVWIENTYELDKYRTLQKL